MDFNDIVGKPQFHVASRPRYWVSVSCGSIKNIDNTFKFWDNLLVKIQ